jgi:uncharacterized protein (DUF924 family)
MAVFPGPQWQGFQRRGSQWHGPQWLDLVLAFWFGELAPALWFTKSDALDAAIRSRFLAQHPLVCAVAPTLPADDRSAVAAVVALDQFSRNMFRGTPAAFASDPAALALAERIVASGADQHWPRSWRTFVYLPFEHAEDLAVQHRSVALMATLGDDRLLDYAHRHLNVIERFGRFPHRNAILGRESTAAELAYLAEPGSGF